MTNGKKRFLSEIEVEQEYGFVKASTLRRWRLIEKGPPYKKLGGSIRYDRIELEAWIAAAPSGGDQI